MIVLVPIDKSSGLKRTSTSYARYLMSVHLGRILLPNEHVDHVDENKLNDDVSNFQILSTKENNKKHRKAKGIKKTFAILKCPSCGITFERPRNKTHLIKNTTFTACSRKCSGKTGGEIRGKSEYEIDKILFGNLVRVECR